MSKSLSVGLNGRNGNLETILGQFAPYLYDVYTPVPKDVFSFGARARTEPLSIDELHNSVKYARTYGVKFNVLLNAACLHGNDFDPGFIDKIRRAVVTLSDIGVDYITIANAKLLGEVTDFRRQNKLPIRIVISSWADVRSSYTAEYFSGLLEPNDRIIIVNNRNLRGLNNIVSILKRKDIQSEVIVNVGCLYKCVYSQFHKMFTSHRNQSYDAVDDPFKTEICIPIRKSNPLEILRAPTIRPEDLWIYRELGIDFFKIAGREFPTEWITKIIGLYIDEEYDGNIADICEQNNAEKMPEIPNELLEGFLTVVGCRLSVQSYAKYTQTFYHEKILNREFNEGFMREAITESMKSTLIPKVGCVIVVDGKIVTRGSHRKEGHAEINALNSLATLYNGNQQKIRIYTTYEPCEACSGRLRLLQPETIVFFGSRRKDIRDSMGYLQRYSEFWSTGPTVIGGVLHKECYEQIRV